MLHFTGILIVGNQVIILIIPNKVERTHLIEGSAMTEFQFLLHRPFHVLVPDLPVMLDGGMEFVDVIVDGFIAGLRTVVGDHLAGKLLSLFSAAQAFKLLDQVL